MNDGTIRIRCGSCGIKLRVKARARSLFCPSCREPIVVATPEPAERRPTEDVVRTAPRRPPAEEATSTAAGAIPFTPAAVGSLAGLVGLTAARWLLPSLDLVALGAALCLLALGFQAAASILRLQARMIGAHLGAGHDAVVRLRRRGSAVLSFGRSCVGAAVLLLAALTFGRIALLNLPPMGPASPPAETRTQSVPPAESASPAAPAPLARSEPFDEQAWSEADFVLVNPSHVANAVRRVDADGRPSYTLLESVAGDERVERAKEAAYRSGVPIIAEDPALARAVHANTRRGAEIPEESATHLGRLWKPYSFTVPGSRLVLFNDLRDRRRRVGFVQEAARRPAPAGSDAADPDPLLAPPAPRFTFFDLLSPRMEGAARSNAALPSEVVPSELVQPGSWRIDPSDSELRSGVDFLDLCMLQIARKIESNEPQHTLVYVDEAWFEPRALLDELQAEGVRAEAVAGALEQFESLAQPRKLSDLIFTALLLPDRSSRSRSPSKEQLEREDQAQRIQAQLRRLQEIERQADRLGGEIRTRLSRVGIPLAARNPVGLIRNGQQARAGVPDFDRARSSSFLGASHLLMTEIRQPDRTGRYEISMRLVDLRGRIVWEDIGDRFNASEQAIELANSPYLLNTGRLVLLDFSGKPRRPVAPSSPDALKGGLPLNLSPIVLKEAPDDASKGRAPGIVVPPPGASPTSRSRRPAPRATAPPAVPAAGIDTRLVYAEDAAELDSPTAGRVRVRDLFSQTVETLDRSSFSSWKVVNGLTDVPEAHVLRYVAWHMSKAILPLAGRVTKAADSSIEIGLSRRDGLTPGDRLTIIRPSDSAEDGRGVETVLPAEFIVTEVHDGGSRAYADRPQGARPRPGDVAHRKSPKKIVVAVPRPTVDTSNVEPQVLHGMSRQELETYIGNTAKELANLLESALVSLKITVVERERLDGVRGEQRTRDVDPQGAAQLGRLVGATHVVLGTVFPDVTRSYRPPATLRVVEVETGLVATRIEFPVLPNWHP